MANQKLEHNIQQLSADYIYHETVSSFLLLLLSAAEDEGREEPLLAYEIHEEILDIKKAVRRYTVQLDTLLNNEEEKIKAASECIALKKSLLGKYEAIYGYFSLWNVFSTALGNETALRKYKKDGIATANIRWDVFFSDCHDFLNSGNTVFDQKNHMGQLLKCIPLKIARNKYFDMIKESLLLAFGGESKEYIDASLRAFEGFCAPDLSPDYGRYFPEIAKWLHSKKTLCPPQLSDEALDSEYDEFQETFQTLTDIEDYFNCIFNDINALILLFSLSYTFEDITERDVAYSDLYHAIAEILNGELHGAEKDATLETALESLNDFVEWEIDKANALGKEEYSLMQKISDFSQLADETKKILITEDFVRNCYYGELNNELFHFGLPENLPPASSEYQNKAFDDFLTHMKDYLNTLPVQSRRVAMEMLLGALPPALSPQEALFMIQGAIHSASSTEEKILILDKAGIVFQDNGFQSRFDQQAEEHHHHHEHNCGCGHEHHHHHEQDCGCGHDHHSHPHSTH